jgi:hypothetical protein
MNLRSRIAKLERLEAARGRGAERPSMKTADSLELPRDLPPEFLAAWPRVCRTLGLGDVSPEREESVE